MSLSGSSRSRYRSLGYYGVCHLVVNRRTQKYDALLEKERVDIECPLPRAPLSTTIGIKFSGLAIKGLASLLLVFSLNAGFITFVCGLACFPFRYRGQLVERLSDKERLTNRASHLFGLLV